ncbi:RMD1 family protein [bacterium]|nr:RMD1 family protein [bacterium]
MGSRYKAEARFSTSRLFLSKILARNDFGKLVKREKSFLLYQLGIDVYLYLKDYGGITFFGFNADTKSETLIKLNEILGIELSPASDEISVIVDSNLKVEGYDELVVENLNIEVVHIICLNLAQSAALFHYQSLSDALLENTKKYTNELELKGKVSLKRKKLMQYIGSTLNIKNKISENLFVFNTPMMAYENESIILIDAHLNDDLEIKYRYNAIKEQLNIIHENLDLFKDMNMHQHSSNLEWIIIWLILFEVIHVIIDQIY